MRRATVTSLVATVLALTAIGCSESPASDPRPGDVFIEDSPMGDDEISFYFGGDEARTTASDRSGGRMEDAGLTTGGVDTRLERDETLLRVEFETTLGDRSQWFERTIPAAVIDALGGRRVLLDLGPGASLSGEAPEVASSPLETTYLLDGEAARYHYRGSFVVASLVGPLGLIFALYLVARRYAAKLRSRPLEDSEKLHRIHRAILVVSLGATPLLIYLFFGTGAIKAPEIVVGEFLPQATGLSSLVGPTWMVLILLGMMLFGLAPLRGLYSEVRHIKLTPSQARRRGARGLAVATVTFGLIIGVNLLQAKTGSGGLRLAMSILMLLILLSIGPLLLGLALGTTEMDLQLRRRVMALCRDQGLRVRDVKVLKGKSLKFGNALIAGVLPGMKYIFLTDYLIENLETQELLAVVAHEVGHGKKHHLLIKLLIPLLAIAPVMAVVAVLVILDIGGSAVLLVALIALPLVLIPAVTLLHGAIGTKMERSADDYACDVVGCEAMIGALERIAEMNMAKRDTGRIFNLLTQHPSIDERIERLRGRLAASQAA